MRKTFILLACAITFTIGCTNSDSSKNDQHKAHAHHEPESYTVYSDQV